MNFGRLNFGLLLISVGIIFLMVNTGKLDSSVWPDLWRFWPVLLITLGIEILFRRSKWWLFTLLAPLLLMAVVWGVVYSHLHGEEGLPGLPQVARSVANRHGTFEVAKKPEIRRLKVRLEFSGGNLGVAGLADESNALTAAYDYRGKPPAHDVTEKDNVQTVEISMPHGWGNYQKNWRIELSRTVPSELELDANVADANLDFTGVPVEKVNVESDVTSLKLAFGSRPGLTEVSVSADVASARIRVPSTCALSVESKSDLSSTNLKDLMLKKTGEKWESDGYSAAACRLSFDINADVSSVSWSRE